MLNHIKTYTPPNINNWGTVGDLDSTKFLKYYPRDRYYSSTSSNDDQHVEKSLSNNQDQYVNPSQRIDQLEKSIVFISQQNSNLIATLHNEVDLLKRQNQELQLKISLVQSIPSANNTENKSVNTLSELEDSDDRRRIKSLERELERLRSIVREEQAKSTSLINLLQHGRFKRRSIMMSADDSSRGGGEFVARPPCHARPSSLIRMTDISPTLPHHEPSRKLNLGNIGSRGECELSESILSELQQLIVKQSQENNAQATELLRIKEDLKEVLYTHKWSPETYLLTKSYVNSVEQKDFDNTCRSNASSSVPKLPEIAANQKVSCITNPPYLHIRGNILSPNKFKQYKEKKT